MFHQMKIIHVTGYYIEDMAYQENLLPAGQVVLGHNVTIFTGVNDPQFTFNQNSRRNIAKHFMDKNVSIERLPHYFSIPGNRGPVLKGLYRKIKGETPDILFIHDVGPSLLVGIIYKLLHNNVILQMDCHSTEANAANSILGPTYHLLFGIILRIFKKLFTSFFAVAPETISFMEDRYFLKKTEITLLPLPGDASAIENYDELRPIYRTKYDFDPGFKYIIHTGKLPEDKLTQDVISAFKHLKSTRQDIKLIICGSIDEDFASEFKVLCEELDIAFLGWKTSSDLKELFLAADLMVQPGSLSNTFIDAICCRLPLLLDDTPQGRHLTQGGNGRVIKRDTAELLAKMINDMLLDTNIQRHRNCAAMTARTYDYREIARLSIVEKK